MPSSSRSSSMSGVPMTPSTPGRESARHVRSSSSPRSAIAVSRAPAFSIPRAGWSTAMIIVVPPSPSADTGRRRAAAASAIASGRRSRASMMGLRSISGSSPGVAPETATRRPTVSGGMLGEGPLVLDEVRAVALAAGEVAARDGLLARVEVDGVGAVRVQVTQERVLPAREREERDRRGDADVDADHARLDLVTVAADPGAGLRGDRRAVTEAAAVDDGDRLVERVDVDHRQDRAEDLLLGDVHLRP